MKTKKSQDDLRVRKRQTYGWFVKISKAVRKTLSLYQTQNCLIKIAHPKRTRTSWNFYVQEKFRPLFQKNSDFSTVMTKLGKKWSNLDDERKERFVRMYLEDRVRFQQEMEHFRAEYAPHHVKKIDNTLTK